MNPSESLCPAMASRGATAACPLCRSERRRTVYAGTIPPERKELVSRYSYDVLPNEHHSIVECLDCGLKYASDRDDSETLARMYGGGGVDSYLRLAAAKLASFRREAESLKATCGKAGKLLEIGCAAGLFLRAADEVGFSVEGCEPWQEAAACAQREFGYRVKNEMFEVSHYEKNSYDAVVLWDVIEHVEDPRRLVGDIHRLLKPGGWLALTTPDYGSLSRRILGTHWQFFERPHLLFFERTSLSMLLQTAGFEDIRVSSLKKVFPLAYVAEYLGKWSRLLSRAALGVIRRVKRLEEFQIQLPIGAMRVYAQKAGEAKP